MVDFWQTMEGHTFRAELKQLSRNIAEMNERADSELVALEKQIYAQLVALDFYQEKGISYEELKAKAKESAKAFLEN